MVKLRGGGGGGGGKNFAQGGKLCSRGGNPRVPPPLCMHHWLWTMTTIRMKSIIRVETTISKETITGNLGKILVSYYGQILPGSITNDLSQPYGNLGKILVGQIWHSSITSDLSEPYDNLGKILVQSLWPNRTFKTSHELDKVLVQFSCLSLSICRLA